MEAYSGEDAAGKLSTVLGAMWSRTHSFVTGVARIEVLQNAAEDEGVTIYTETAATELLVDGNGKVVGAKAEKADGTQITINTAKGVVLASGGYCANPAMVKEYDQYWGDDLSDRTLSTNAGTNTGDGIIMAQAIGADVTGMEVAQMMPSSSPIKGTMTDGIWGDASEQVWVDANGDRFVNEYAERDVLAKASLQLENGIFYIIYAGRTYGDNGMLQGVEADNPRITGMVEGGHIWYGETLAELAEKSATMAGGAAPAFTEEELRETIELYNSYVEAQHDDDFGKENLAGAIDLGVHRSHRRRGHLHQPPQVLAAPHHGRRGHRHRSPRARHRGQRDRRPVGGRRSDRRYPRRQPSGRQRPGRHLHLRPHRWPQRFGCGITRPEV